MKKTDIIRKASKEIGEYHGNKELIIYIKNKYKVNVLSSHVTNTLGSLAFRRSVFPKLLRSKAIEFLSLCNDDKLLAYRLLRMVA